MKEGSALTAREQKAEENKERLIGGGIAFSAAMVFAVLLSLAVSLVAGAIAGTAAAGTDWYLYLSYLVPQLALFGATALYFARSKEPVRMLAKGCRFRYFPIAVLLEFGLLFSLSLLNDLLIEGLSRIGYHAEVSVPDLSGWNLLPAIVVIALLPAIFEEIMFRGLLTRNMHADGWGLVATVLVSGAIFSLYHRNPVQTVYQFCCGACFSLVAVRAGSIFPTMLAHFLNNALILTLTSCGVGNLAALPPWAFAVIVVFAAVALLGSLVYLLFFDRKENRRGGIVHGRAFFASSSVGLAVCAVMWVVALVSGFSA